MNICKTTQPQKRKNKEETQQLPGRKCKGKRTTNDSPTTGAGASSTASATTKNNNDIAVETTFPPLNRHQGSTTPPSPDDTENLLSGPLLLTPKEDQNQFSASVAAQAFSPDGTEQYLPANSIPENRSPGVTITSELFQIIVDSVRIPYEFIVGVNGEFSLRTKVGHPVPWSFVRKALEAFPPTKLEIEGKDLMMPLQLCVFLRSTSVGHEVPESWINGLAVLAVVPLPQASSSIFLDNDGMRNEGGNLSTTGTYLKQDHPEYIVRNCVSVQGSNQTTSTVSSSLNQGAPLLHIDYGYHHPQTGQVNGLRATPEQKAQLDRTLVYSYHPDLTFVQGGASTSAAIDNAATTNVPDSCALATPYDASPGGSATATHRSTKSATATHRSTNPDGGSVPVVKLRLAFFVSKSFVTKKRATSILKEFMLKGHPSVDSISVEVWHGNKKKCGSGFTKVSFTLCGGIEVFTAAEYLFRGGYGWEYNGMDVSRVEVHTKEWCCLNPLCKDKGVKVDGNLEPHQFNRNPNRGLGVCRDEGCGGRQWKKLDEAKTQWVDFTRG